MTRDQRVKRLTKILDAAIKDNDYNKVKYIWQFLDCKLFDKNTSFLQPVFDKADGYLVDEYKKDKKKYPYSKLDDTKYEDLEKLRIGRCCTFDLFAFVKQ